MGCADLVISKPGGLTTSECLARGLPMVIVNPIPGQESRNSDYLLENGAGVKVNHVCTLTAKVNELLNDPDRLARLRAAAKAIGHPQAAFDVARRSLAVIGVRDARAGALLRQTLTLPSPKGEGVYLLSRRIAKTSAAFRYNFETLSLRVSGRVRIRNEGSIVSNEEQHRQPSTADERAAAGQCQAAGPDEPGQRHRQRDDLSAAA